MKLNMEELVRLRLALLLFLLGSSMFSFSLWALRAAVAVLRHPSLELPKLLHAGAGVHGHIHIHGPVGLPPQQ
jgi:hypothetical protein